MGTDSGKTLRPCLRGNSGHFHPPREAGTANTTDSVFARDTLPYYESEHLGSVQKLLRRQTVQ